jgi:teichuronic acid exporter
VLSGLRWVTASRLAAQLITWAITFFVIRIISPADLGLSSLAGLFATFLLMLSELGFSVALVQRQIRDRDVLKAVFGALLLIGATFALLLILAAPLIGVFMKDMRVVPLARTVSIQFLTISFSVIPQARLSMDFRFKELAVVNIAASLISALTTLFVALNGGGAWSLISGIVMLAIARAVLLNVFQPSLMLPRFSFSSIRPLAGFSGLVLLERTLWYWYMQVDSFVVGRSLGAAQLGVYAVGRQVTNIPLERTMEIVNSVALPAFSVVKHDLDHVRRGYLKLLRLGAGYAFPVFWGLATVSSPLVELVLGDKWSASAAVIQVLCISMPLRMLNSLTSAAATSISRQDVNIKSLALAIVLVPTGVAFGSRWGVTGVAAGWAVTFPIVYAFNAALVKRALGISIGEMAIALWPSAVSAAIMDLAIYGLQFTALPLYSAVLRILCSVLLGSAVYVSCLSLLSRETSREVWDLVRGLLGGAESNARNPQKQP